MKKMFLTGVVFVLVFLSQANAQFKVNIKTTDAAKKLVKAASFSDAGAAGYAKESIDWMDTHNTVADAHDKYMLRLNRIFAPHLNEEGLTLNFKVYKVTDVNAFACADGSVRIFSALMDIMSDEELLAIIGHEIGHVKNHDSRDAIRSAYTRAGGKDLIFSQSGEATAFTQSQIGIIAESLLCSSHSRKQEAEADSYSYDFLKNHNYNVMAAYTAFMKLDDLSKNASEQSKFQKMFNSHPDNKVRAEEIEKKAKQDDLWKEPAYLVYDGTR